MNKKQYTKPLIDSIYISSNNVIVTSNTSGEEPHIEEEPQDEPMDD